MKLQREHYRDDVAPVPSELQVVRMWRNIERAPLGRSRSHRYFVLATVAVAAALLLVLVHFYPRSDRRGDVAVAGAALENASKPDKRIGLADGSTVVVGSGTRLVLSQASTTEVRLELLHGRADFEVTRNPDRQFEVVASGYTVRVVGTRFSVSYQPAELAGRFTVAVQQGIVELRRPNGALLRLEAGEHWSSAALPENEASPAAQPSPEPPPSAAQGSRVDGLGSSTAKTPTEPAVDAKELLERANRARVQGRALEAATALETLWRQHQQDPRASLAALQLGRIRADQLGDIAGAVEAWRGSLALGGGASQREDAMARLIEGYARLGNREKCREMRRTYLEQFPRGAQRASVERRCAP